MPWVSTENMQWVHSFKYLLTVWLWICVCVCLCICVFVFFMCLCACFLVYFCICFLYVYTCVFMCLRACAFSYLCCLYLCGCVFCAVAAYLFHPPPCRCPSQMWWLPISFFNDLHFCNWGWISFNKLLTSFNKPPFPQRIAKCHRYFWKKIGRLG